MAARIGHGNVDRTRCVRTCGELDRGAVSNRAEHRDVCDGHGRAGLKLRACNRAPRSGCGDDIRRDARDRTTTEGGSGEDTGGAGSDDGTDGEAGDPPQAAVVNTTISSIPILVSFKFAARFLINTIT
jgi:hypothetical protein